MDEREVWRERQTDREEINGREGGGGGDERETDGRDGRDTEREKRRVMGWWWLKRQTHRD